MQSTGAGGGGFWKQLFRRRCTRGDLPRKNRGGGGGGCCRRRLNRGIEDTHAYEAKRGQPSTKAD